MKKHGPQGGWIRLEVTPEKEETIQIIVRDNGCGISEENRKRIFSPFFTTKPVGKGTGLGLSVCYGIIENMGGTMDFESIPDKGTAFFITLPISRKKISPLVQNAA